MIARNAFALLTVAAVLGGNRFTAAETQSPIVIVVSLPADAQLWVNEIRTAATGELREFQDSQVQPGSVYRYALRAVVERGGRAISQERVLRLAAGGSARVEFTLPLQTKALKPPQPSDDLLAQVDSFQRSQFQPLPTEESDLPALPDTPADSSDGFRPRQPELGEPIDSGALPTEQPEFLDLSDPADAGRFGRQFGDEPEAEPAPANGDLFPPDETADPMQLESQVDPPTANAATVSHAPSIWAAYVGHGHEHHLTGETGTALHVWNHAWRMARLVRADADAGPYIVYHEADHDGFTWAYGRSPIGCHQCPVYFKPGAETRWRLVGYAQRVRPHPH